MKLRHAYHLPNTQHRSREIFDNYTDMQGDAGSIQLVHFSQNKTNESVKISKMVMEV